MASGQGSAQFGGPYVTAPSDVSPKLLLLDNVTDRSHRASTKSVKKD
jgi:hypothetical protein